MGTKNPNETNNCFRGRAERMTTAWLNKRTGCKSPRCRRCKCRDGLSLVKASHWSNLRRQTIHRLRHESEDLRKQEYLLCPGTGWCSVFVTQKNGCGDAFEHCRSRFL